MRPLAEHIDRLEFNSMTGVAIAVAYWRRRSPSRKQGRPENGRPYEGWKMSKVQLRGINSWASLGGPSGTKTGGMLIRLEASSPPVPGALTIPLHTVSEVWANINRRWGGVKK